MAIDVIASVIPNIRPSADEYRLYIYLTPRISCSGLQTIDDFRHVYHWTDCLDHFGNDIEFTFINKDLSAIPNSTFRGVLIKPGYRANGLKTTDNWKTNPGGKPIAAADEAGWRRTIWRGMFGPSTPVDGWELDKSVYNLVKRADLSDLNNAMNQVILQAKDKLLANRLADLQIPGIYDDPADEERQKRHLVALLDQLYDLSPDRKLHSPYLQPGTAITFPAFLKDIYSQMKVLADNRNQELGDISFDLTLPQVADRNNTAMNEFHNKMASFGNFPFLLKQTGWIWEYSIKKDQLNKLLGQEYFVTTKFTLASPADPSTSLSAGCASAPDRQDFIESVNFVYPYTSVRVEADKINYGFRDSAELSYPVVTDGFILANQDYGAEMQFVEKNQVFDRMGQILRENYDFSYNNSQPPGNAAQQQQLQDKLNSQLAQNQGQLQVASQEYLQQQQARAAQPVSSDYNSSGFSVRFFNVKGVVEASVNASPGANTTPFLNNETLGRGDRDLLENASAIIYGHNIHKGYRPDVFWSDGTGADPGNESLSRPLCRRRVYYTIDFRDYKPDATECILEDQPCVVDDDEGWVIESAQSSNSGSLYLDEELFRYNDWSLSADILLRASELDANEKAIAQNSYLNIFSVPLEGSLPVLRFGRRYSLALRFTDICGGGPDPLYVAKYPLPDGRPAAPVITGPQRYPRTQGVGAPLLFLGEYLHKNGQRATQDYLDHTTGQDLQTMVIRSAYDANTHDLGPSTATAIRYMGPPKLDFQLIKKHGVFDAMMNFAARVSTNGDALNTPANQQAVQAKYVRLMKMIPPPPPPVADPENPVEEVIHGPDPIDYLFDPLVWGYAIAVNGIDEGSWSFANGPLTAIGDDRNATDAAHLYLDSARYLPLRLAENNDPSSGDYDILNGQSTITLSKGVEKSMEIRAALIRRLTVFQKAANPAYLLNDLVYNNEVQVSKITLQLVHAVQKPCLLYAGNSRKFRDEYIGEVYVVGRSTGDTLVNIVFSFTLFPCLTATAYLLHAKYRELVSCRKTCLPDGTPNTTGYQVLDIDKVILSSCQPDRPGFEQGVQFSRLAHSFSDSKYRSIQYSMEAVSKFKKYFPASVKDFSIKGSHETAAIVLSSHQPPVLEVDRVVPLIHWDGDVNDSNGLGRNCDTVRIYFKGDWFLTGEEESVAVFFTNVQKNGQDDEDDADMAASSGNVPRELENALSQFGLDPAIQYEGEKNQLFFITTDFFDGSGTPPDVQFVLFGDTVCSADNKPYSLRVKNLDFDGNDHNPYAETEVVAAIYKVKYMRPPIGEETGRFYIDIRIGIQKRLRHLYCPFLRFAIARYQPHTVNPVVCADVPEEDPAFGSATGIDARFSKITLVDFVQLLPYRNICLQGNSLIYKGHALRASAPEGPAAVTLYNKLYFYFAAQGMGTDGSLFPLTVTDDTGRVIQTGQFKTPGLTTEMKTMSADGKTDITSTTADFSFSVNINDKMEPFVIEEYETYDSNEVLPNDMDPREDVRQRLILSYVHEQK